MSNLLGLRCVSCSTEYETEAIDYTCPKCGPLRGTLDVVYDYHQVAQKLTRTTLAESPGGTTGAICPSCRW